MKIIREISSTMILLMETELAKNINIYQIHLTEGIEINLHHWIGAASVE